VETPTQGPSKRRVICSMPENRQLVLELPAEMKESKGNMVLTRKHEIRQEGRRDWASTELERNDGEYSSDRLVSIVEEAEKRGAYPGLLSERPEWGR